MASERADGPVEFDLLVGEWPHEVSAEVLNRVKSVAQRIAERVRQVTDDTRTDHTPLPDGPTQDNPPLP